MLLEKKLKFFSIIDNMRNSTKLQMEGEEAQKLAEKLRESEKQNEELREKVRRLEKKELEEELKATQKLLKKQKKIHEADLYVLSNLQMVGIGWSNERNSSKLRRIICI